MNIYRVTCPAHRQKVAEVSSYAEARSYLSKIGRIVLFDGDSSIGGADVLVVPSGGTFPEQYDISI